MTQAPTHPEPRRSTPFPWRPVLTVLLVPVVLVVVLVAALHTPWGMKTVANQALRAVPLWPETRLEAAAARGGFGSGIELYGIRLIAPNGPLAGVIDTLRVSYQLHELLGNPRRVREIRIAGLQLLASRLPRAVAKDRKSRADRRPPQVTLDRLELHRTDLEIHVSSFGRDSVLLVKGLDLTITDFRLHESTSLALDTLSATLVSPAAPAESLRLAMRGRLTPTRLELDTLSIAGVRTRVTGAGTLPVKGGEGASFVGADFSLYARPLAGADIERFLPFLGNPGDLTLGMVARSRGSRLHATVDARAARGGHVALEATVAAAGGPISLHTDGRVDDLDLGALRGGAADSLVIDASWRAELDGPDRAHLSGPIALTLDGSRVGDLRFDEARIEGALADRRATVNARARGEGFALTVAGWATPLDSIVAYDASAVLSLARVPYPPRSPFSPPPDSLADSTTLFAGDTEIQIRGRGLSADRAQTIATLELRPDSTTPSLLGAGRVAANLDAGVARWRVDLQATSGSIRASGDFGLSPELSYRIHRAEIAGVDIAAFAGDTTASRLDLVLRAEGRGAEPDRIRATAVIDSLALAYGIHRIAGGTATVNLDRGRARFESAVTVDQATVQASGTLEPLSQPKAARIAFDVRDLDLAKVTGDSLLTSQLAGHVRAELRGSDLAAWLGTPTRNAAIESGRGLVRIELEPSSVGDQHIAVFDLRGDLERGTVKLGGRLESSFGEVRLAGTARPFDAVPTLRLTPLAFSSFSPLLLVGRPDPALEFEGRLDAELSGRSLAELSGNLDLVLDGSRVNSMTFDQLAVHSRMGEGTIETHLTARAADDSADVALIGAPFLDPRRLHAAGRIRSVGLASMLGIDSVRAGAGLEFTFDGRQPRGGGVDDLVLSGSVAGNAWLGEARLDTVAGEFNVEHGVAQVPRLALRGNVLNADGGGRVVLPRSRSREATDVRLTGTLDRIELLPPLPGIKELAGSARIQVAASGPLGATGISGDLKIARPHINEIWADSAEVHFTGLMHDTVLARLDATIQAHRLVAWPLLARNIDATAVWDGTGLVVDSRSALDDRRSDHITVRLEPMASGVRGRLEAFELLRRRLNVTLQKPAAFEFSGITRIDDLVLLENGVPRLRVDGGIDSAGMADLRVDVDSLDLSDYLDLAGLPALQGHLSFEGSVTGRRDRPVFDVSMRARLVSGKRKPAWITGRLAWADSAFDLTTEFEQSAGHRIALESHLPLALTLAPARGRPFVTTLEAPMSSRFQAERFDFSWFEPLISPRVARQPRGWLNGDVRIQGEPGIPEVSGLLALTEAQVELPPLGVRYQHGEARLSFAGRTITLDRASVTSGGRAEARGSATFHGRGRRTVDLTLSLDRFIPLNTLEAKATLSGEATLAGNLSAPQLRGTIKVHNTTTNIETGGEANVESVELTARDRLDIKERFGVGAGSNGQATPPLLDRVDVDLTIAIGDNVWVRRRSDPVVALELEGDLHARKPAGGALDARGTLGIRTGRSFMSFAGRRFDLTHAEVDLPGPLAEARVVVEAFYSPQTSGSSSADVEVTAVVTIDANGVVTDLRSEPYLDQSALLNYLATGQVQGGMESGTAYGLAAGAALGAVGGAAGRSLGLDVVQVTMDANGGQTLSAGSYIDPRIYLGFRQPVVQDQTRGTSSTSGATPTEFEVELEARRNLLFNVQGSSARYRFLFRPRLGR